MKITIWKSEKYPIIFTICTLIILVVSFIMSLDKFTWPLEMFPVIIGFPILFFTYKSFKFTKLVYSLLLVHFIIMAIGSIYTYANVPFGFWMQEKFHFARNHYDRIGHLAQGFIPALLVREVLLAKTPLKSGGWLFFIIVSICLSISAFYELIEWWVTVWQGASAEAFLGSQGDVWDAQADMFCALIGAIIALLTLSKFQNYLLRKKK